MNRLFVYGIFLSEQTRQAYGMSHPEYAVVLGYVTTNRGGSIVMARRATMPDYTLGLTGLVVDVDPQHWERLDALERGYDRIVVTLTSGERAYMYAAPERQSHE